MPVPRQARTIQHVDFSSRGADDETALRQLVRTLETSTARVTEEAAEIGGSPGFPPSQPPKTEKTWFQNRLAALRSGYRHATFVLNNRYAVAIVGIIIGFVVWWQWPRRQESGVVPPPAPQPAQTAYTTTIREARGGLIVPQMVEIPAGNFRRGDIQGGGDKNESAGPQCTDQATLCHWPL